MIIIRVLVAIIMLILYNDYVVYTNNPPVFSSIFVHSSHVREGNYNKFDILSNNYSKLRIIERKLSFWSGAESKVHIAWTKYKAAHPRSLKEERKICANYGRIACSDHIPVGKTKHTICYMKKFNECMEFLNKIL